MLITLAGIFTIFENTLKFLAFRYEEAAKLQKLAFLPNVWNFSVDGLILHTTFGSLQLAGFISLFVFYGIELVTFYFIRVKTDEEKEENLTGNSSKSENLNEKLLSLNPDQEQ